MYLIPIYLLQLVLRYRLKEQLLSSFNGIVDNIEAFVFLSRCAAAVPRVSRVEVFPIKFCPINVSKEWRKFL